MLPMYDKTGIGPGLIPKSVAALIGALGVVIMGMGLGAGRAKLERFTVRGPLFVLAAVAVFAVTIRPLGLAFAGPLAVMLSALGEKTTRPLELVVFAVVLSAACIALFKYTLRLPIPLAPFLLGY
jgi:putative tricarboxylic transport membrane protein